MKKLIFYILAATLMTACASTSTAKFNSHITVANIKISDCQPAESWNVSVMGYGTMVLRFDNCLNIKRLLAVSASSDQHTQEIRNHSIELLSFHYLEYLKRTNPDSAWSIQKINEEHHKEGKWLVYFYAIEEKKTKCTKEECKPKEE